MKHSKIKKRDPPLRTNEIEKGRGWSETTDLPLRTTKIEANHQVVLTWVAVRSESHVRSVSIGWIRNTTDNNNESHWQQSPATAMRQQAKNSKNN